MGGNLQNVICLELPSNHNRINAKMQRVFEENAGNEMIHLFFAVRSEKKRRPS